MQTPVEGHVESIDYGTILGQASRVAQRGTVSERVRGTDDALGGRDGILSVREHGNSVGQERIERLERSNLVTIHLIQEQDRSGILVFDPTVNRSFNVATVRIVVTKVIVLSILGHGDMERAL